MSDLESASLGDDSAEEKAFLVLLNEKGGRSVKVTGTFSETEARTLLYVLNHH